jgi:hypothetical protein
MTISIEETGADRSSYIVPVNLGKKMPNEALERLCVSSESMISPGTMKAP